MLCGITVQVVFITNDYEEIHKMGKHPLLRLSKYVCD